MKKPTIFITILTIAIFGFGGMLYLRFFCPTCLASGKEEITSSTINQPRKEKPASAKKLTSAPKVGSLAPTFILEDSAGREVSLEDFKNKKNVLLVFWATYCSWCEKERPDLNRFSLEKKDKIEVLAIAQDSKEALKRYTEAKQIDFTLLADPEREVQTKYLAFATPIHYLINKQGVIVLIQPGYTFYQSLLMLTQILEAE